MQSTVPGQPVFATGTPRVLFTGDYASASTPSPNYDVSRDGRRFLMAQPSAHATPTQIVVVVNWFDELKRL